MTLTLDGAPGAVFQLVGTGPFTPRAARFTVRR